MQCKRDQLIILCIRSVCVCVLCARFIHSPPMRSDSVFSFFPLHCSRSCCKLQQSCCQTKNNAQRNEETTTPRRRQIERRKKMGNNNRFLHSLERGDFRIVWMSANNNAFVRLFSGTKWCGVSAFIHFNNSCMFILTILTMCTLHSDEYLAASIHPTGARCERD